MLFFYYLSFLQIILEALPVSSSGHLVLFASLYPFTISLEYWHPFWMHVLHLPTALVVGYYFRSLWFALFQARGLSLFFFVFIVDLITFFFYLLEPFINYALPLPLAFTTTALMLFSLRYLSLPYALVGTTEQAVIVGIVQGLVLLFPGVSRLAAVFVTLCWLGITPGISFALSWLVLWPLMTGAGLVGLIKLYRYGLLSTLLTPVMIISIVIAALISLLLVRLMDFLVRTDRFWWIGCYLIIPGLLSLICMMMHKSCAGM